MYGGVYIYYDCTFTASGFNDLVDTACADYYKFLFMQI